MVKINNLLAVGDCITLGVGNCLGNSYPERVGKRLGCPVTNRGYTMSTSREGTRLLHDNLQTAHDCVILQFGVADSLLSFRYTPYILYYPDNRLRKMIRNIVKKYKKTARNTGMNKRLGEARVVSEKEYRNNYMTMIERCGDKLVILPETIPQHETSRNPAIKRYNRIIQDIAWSRDTCILIEFFDDFLANMNGFYLDMGHPNEIGYEHIADKILEALEYFTVITATASTPRNKVF